MVSGQDERVSSGTVRRTRPANRRQLIVRGAAELFATRGYAKVSISDVADAEDIAPSALYRHFRGKQELLATVVQSALATIDDVLAASTDADVPARLATAVLEYRNLGVLILREARHLSAADRATTRTAIAHIGGRVAELIGERRPELDPADRELLAWCALATTSSLSFHTLTLPEAAFLALIRSMITAVIDAPLPPAEPTATSGTPADRGALTPRSRRAAIMTEAVKLFARNGFANVTMEDIGAGVGIAGPSVYNHFPGKPELLAAIMFRGAEWLWLGLQRAFARAVDPRDGLHRLLEGYQAFAFENPDFVQVLISESMHLPEADQQRTRAAQHEYIAEWVDLACRVHPGWDPVEARIRVQATQMVINDMALMPHLRDRSGIDTRLDVVGSALLEISR